MNEAVPQAACFRHVVFPGSAGGYNRAVNLAPARHVDTAAARRRPRTYRRFGATSGAAA